MRGDGIFVEKIQKIFDVSRRKYGFNQERIALSIKFFQIPRNRPQYTLFEAYGDGE